MKMKPGDIAGATALLLISVLIGELLLRFVPSPIQHPPLYERDDPNSLIGIEFVPNTRQQVVSSCFRSDVSINSHGWRDRERSFERDPNKTRIAVLGDSFTEGSGVNDDETVTRQLEKMLGEDKFEVLNFGISSIGTVQQDILYEHVVERYDPDIVLLLFYVNDVHNNLAELEGGEEKNTHLHYRKTDGSVISYSRPSAFFGLRKWLRSHSAVFRLIKMVHSRLLASFRESATGTESLPMFFEIYNSPRDFLDAWSATAYALQQLRNRIGTDRTFIVTSVPDLYQIAPDIRTLLQQQYDTEPSRTFSPLNPQRQLFDIAEHNDIDTIDLHAAFVQYRDEHQLEYPYFFFECDGHWSDLGHRVAAEVLARELKLFL